MQSIIPYLYYSSIRKALNEQLIAHTNLNYLLVFFVILFILSGFLLFKNFQMRKDLSLALQEKSNLTREHSRLIKEKNKELEQFAYIASHDLKEPLVTISNLIFLFKEEYEHLINDTGKKSLKFITQSSDRMKSLIDGLLTYSRLGKSKAFTTVNCNDLLSIVESDLEQITKSSKAILVINELPTIKGSATDLRLLFQNLISNSIKYVKPDTRPKIEISCEKRAYNSDPSKSFWEFTIKDNGIGIAEIHKERIFSIFQKLNPKDKYNGTGIGLSHCKKIIEAHNGNIRMESKLGEGSTFFISIPAI